MSEYERVELTLLFVPPEYFRDKRWPQGEINGVDLSYFQGFIVKEGLTVEYVTVSKQVLAAYLGNPFDLYPETDNAYALGL